jgi:hypothetical protein
MGTHPYVRALNSLTSELPGAAWPAMMLAIFAPVSLLAAMNGKHRKTLQIFAARQYAGGGADQLENGTAVPQLANQPGYAHLAAKRAAAPALDEAVSWVAPQGVIDVDQGWSDCSAIEWQALQRMRRLTALPSETAYIGYPWADLIEARLAKSNLVADPTGQLLQFATFCATLPPQHGQEDYSTRGHRPQRATLCQHPQLLAHLALFHQAKVSHIFWPFCTPQAQAQAQAAGLTLHPCPHPHTGPQHGAGPQHDIGQDRTVLLCDLRGKVSLNTPQQSLFALCPAGAAGNSAELWHAVMAGAVPLMLTSMAGAEACAGLPGPATLWQAAVLVRSSDTPEPILHAELLQIAADPVRLTALRDAAAQLTLVYKAADCAQDIYQTLLTLARTPGDDAAGEPASRLDRARQRLETATLPDLPEAIQLATCAAISTAQTALPADHPARQQFEAALAHAERQKLAAPSQGGHAVPRIYLLGPRSARTPLGYAAFQRIAADRIQLSHQPETADLILTGWNRDLEENAAALAPMLRARPQLKLAVISEEPLWDTLWSGGFADRNRVFDCAGSPQSYRFLNHMNSRIFDFDRIPYFLLTSDSFFGRYVALLAGFVARSPQEMLAHWQTAPLQAAFCAEYRDDPSFDLRYDAGRLFGLSRYRSLVAQHYPEPAVLRLGQGWPQQNGQAQTLPHQLERRQDLPDWHLDKLARLHGRVRLCSAYENTHQHCYISEKLFDAFAVGGIALYHAGPGHRVHGLIAPEALLNSFGRGPAQAAAWAAAYQPDLAMARAWLASAAELLALLSDGRAVIAERRRVVAETLGEIHALL